MNAISALALSPGRTEHDAAGTKNCSRPKNKPGGACVGPNCNKAHSLRTLEIYSCPPGAFPVTVCVCVCVRNMSCCLGCLFVCCTSTSDHDRVPISSDSSQQNIFYYIKKCDQQFGEGPPLWSFNLSWLFWMSTQIIKFLLFTCLFISERQQCTAVCYSPSVPCLDQPAEVTITAVIRNPSGHPTFRHRTRWYIHSNF